MTPSQIGVLLRDSNGIPQITTVTGSKVLRILKASGLAPEIPEDLYHLIKKAVSMRKHLERNRKDKDGKFRLILVESRIHRLARYYKVRGAPGGSPLQRGRGSDAAEPSAPPAPGRAPARARRRAHPCTRRRAPSPRRRAEGAQAAAHLEVRVLHRLHPGGVSSSAGGGRRRGQQLERPRRRELAAAAAPEPPCGLAPPGCRM
jgi:ribosomal protein S15P/S13E